jgi:hypothetical protein
MVRVNTSNHDKSRITVDFAALLLSYPFNLSSLQTGTLQNPSLTKNAALRRHHFPKNRFMAST